MKKTTVRFAAVGTVLVLSALAIALAQHDSRQRPRDTEQVAKSVSTAPQPILVDAIEPSFHGTDRLSSSADEQDYAPAAPRVRANDNPVFGTPPSLPLDGNVDRAANPLRQASATSSDDGQVEPLGATDDTSSVAFASGEGEPASLPTLPSLPPSFGAQPLPIQSAPNLPSTTRSDAPPSSNAPSVPGNAPVNALSVPGNAPPGWVNSSALPPKQNLANQSLSDTQRPAMPATSLPPASRGGQQPWLQAPSMPNTGLSSARPGSLSAGGPSPAGTGSVGTSPAGASPVGTSPLGMSPVGTSPVAGSPAGSSPLGGNAASPMSGEPTSTPSGAARVRLSDGPEAPIASGQAQGFPSLPPSQGFGSPVGTAPQPLGARPMAPSASLGSPQPLSPSGAPSKYYEDLAPPSGLSSPQSSAQPSEQLPGMTSIPPRGQLASGNTRSLLAGTALGSLVSNQPGNRHLDGSQNPIMLIQKRTAGECQVGKPATIIITVRNSGNATAHNVEVIDSVPSGASFAEAIPAATPTPEGVIVWQLGEMAPGDERTINLQIIPERQGELGSVASVRFAAQASVRTLATLPKIELAYTSAPDALIGSQHAVSVVVKNVGTGVARNVRLEADLPPNIRHESGDAGLEANFGDIAPGESKTIRLDSIAAEAGKGVCTIRALTDDGLQHEQTVDVHVLAPALQATINGPSKRYLDRQATFEIMIQNTGTAPATDCEFVLRLPTGLNFNTANHHGTYDPDQHAVLWSLPELPAGATGTVELTVLPVQAGTQAMTFQAMAALGVKAEARGELTVEEQAELAFTIEQDADPIELSSSTTYTVEVRNVGRVDRQVQLTAQLPPGSKVLKVDVDAPVRHSIQGDQLVFEPVPEMQSRTGHKFRFEVQHVQVGTQIVRAQLRSQNRPTPVIKEEATDVYNDRN